MHGFVALSGLVFRAVVTAGWPNTKLVYHLSEPDGDGQRTICGRINSAYPRPDDDDPRPLCANCRSSLHGRLERGPLVGLLPDDPAWRAAWAELEAYERSFVRPRPAWVRTEHGHLHEGVGRDGPWRSFVRQGAKPDCPEFNVGPAKCADLVVAGSSDYFRTSVRWFVAQAGRPVTRYWVELYVRSPGEGEDDWYDSTPRHDPIKLVVAAHVAGAELD